LPCHHRIAAINHESEQRTSLAFAHLLPQVASLEHQALPVAPAPLHLEGRRRANGGIDREVVDLFLWRGAHVAAAAVRRLARRALAALLAHPSLPRQVDAPQVESL